MSKKISKHPVYDDPTAFSKNFPRIEEVTGAGGGTLLSKLTPERAYKMGPIRANVAAPTPDRDFYFMSVHGRDRYPTWDEVVWLRYNLIPDAAVMAMLQPNLNSYINREDTHHKFVFTMEQIRWALDPVPVCETCGVELANESADVTTAVFKCAACGSTRTIDMTTWNEEHGNGLLARR